MSFKDDATSTCELFQPCILTLITCLNKALKERISSLVTRFYKAAGRKRCSARGDDFSNIQNRTTQLQPIRLLTV